MDDTGAKAWEAPYTGFGKATLETQTITNNLRLPGQYFDAETGLHYNGNRYYDPDTGRYLRTDPLALGIEGGLNLYVYAMNSPLMFTDPDGLIARDAYNDVKTGVKDWWFEGAEEHWARNDVGQPKPPNTKEDLRGRDDFFDFENFGGTPTHNMLGTAGNSDWRNSNTGEQYIFNQDNYLVDDDLNGGSFDKASPANGLGEHMGKDVIPWLKWGNTPNDPSTPLERTSALIETFVYGADKKLDKAINDIENSTQRVINDLNNIENWERAFGGGGY